MCLFGVFGLERGRLEGLGGREEVQDGKERRKRRRMLVLLIFGLGMIVVVGFWRYI